MTTLSLFTPISTGTYLSDLASSYLNLGSQTVVLLDPKKGYIEKAEQSCWLVSLKVVSYLTLILPIIALIIHLATRPSIEIVENPAIVNELKAARRKALIENQVLTLTPEMVAKIQTTVQSHIDLQAVPKTAGNFPVIDNIRWTSDPTGFFLQGEKTFFISYSLDTSTFRKHKVSTAYSAQNNYSALARVVERDLDDQIVIPPAVDLKLNVSLNDRPTEITLCVEQMLDTLRNNVNEFTTNYGDFVLTAKDLSSVIDERLDVLVHRMKLQPFYAKHSITLGSPVKASSEAFFSFLETKGCSFKLYESSAKNLFNPLFTNLVHGESRPFTPNLNISLKNTKGTDINYSELLLEYLNSQNVLVSHSKTSPTTYLLQF